MDILRHAVVKNSSIPAHLQVRARILGLVRGGTLAPGTKLPSEPEIAELFSVSRMTANKAILSLVADGWLTRGKGKGTFVATAAGSPRRVAVMINEEPIFAAEDYYFGVLYWSVQSFCSEHSISTDLVGLGRPVDPSPELGLISINPSEPRVEDLCKLARGGSPVVLLGSSWTGFGLSSVDSDNVLGAALAVNHLADQGHRSVLFLGACPEDSNTQDRLKGFWTAVKSRGSLDPARCQELVTDTALGYGPETEADILRRLYALEGPTAIFAAGARLAMQVLTTVRTAGLRVPEDVAIVGYDDPEFLQLCFPSITTIRQPLAEMASRACQMILDQISTRDPRAERVLLEPSLIIRGSSVSRLDHAPSGHISE